MGKRGLWYNQFAMERVNDKQTAIDKRFES